MCKFAVLCRGGVHEHVYGVEEGISMPYSTVAWGTNNMSLHCVQQKSTVHSVGGEHVCYVEVVR